MSILNPPIVLANSTPNICYPKNNICNIPKGKTLRLRRVSDDDETFHKRSLEYQNYIIARDYKSSIVKQQFSEVKKEKRSKARQNKLNNTR